MSWDQPVLSRGPYRLPYAFYQLAFQTCQKGIRVVGEDTSTQHATNPGDGTLSWAPIVFGFFSLHRQQHG